MGCEKLIFVTEDEYIERKKKEKVGNGSGAKLGMGEEECNTLLELEEYVAKNPEEHCTSPKKVELFIMETVCQNTYIYSRFE